MLNKLYYPQEKEDSSGRKFYYDNLKFILIVLVVIGHFIERMESSHTMQSIFFFIYIFHMPLFVFITGLNSKSMLDENNNLKVNKIISFMIIYIVLKSVLFLIETNLLGENLTFKIFSESGVPWYLLATCIWYSLIPIIKKIKPVYAVLISILIALIAGYDKSIFEFLSFSRVLCFMPFFMIGYYLSEHKLEKLLDIRVVFRIVAFFLIISMFLLILCTQINVFKFTGIVTGRIPYILLETNQIYGGLYRAIWYGISTFICMCVMLIIPRCKTFFTEFGKRTLQVYVLHIIIIKLFMGTEWFAIIKNAPHEYVGIIIVPIALTFILSLKPFGFFTDTILKANYKTIIQSSNKDR